MNRNPETLEPKSGFDREIGTYITSLERVREQVVELVSDMTRDGLAARISPSFHQIGGLVLHLGETEFHWIEAMAAGKTLTDDDRNFAHLDDTTENDFALKMYDASDCVRVLDRVHGRVLATLAKFRDDDLDRLIAFENHPSKFSASLRWILHHLIDHESHHKGQFSLMKRLIREKASV